MRSFLIALLMLASGTTLAAPTLETPASAAAGSTITFKANGTGNPREFVTVVPKGTREGAYEGYVYVTGTADLKLAMPAKPGDYELRLCAADSPYKTLVAKPIQLIIPKASVSSAATITGGAPFEVQWTGPNNERDYIAIGETTPGGRLYLDYKYSRDGSPLKLVAPEKPGNYEIRYILGVGDTVIARQAVAVGNMAAASVTAPAQVAAGAKIKLNWTGPNNARDFITMVKAGAAEKSYERYAYTSVGSTLELTAPDVPGNYELRYATGREYTTLARTPITVGAISGSVTGPATVVAGENFKASWKGPDNPRNYVTIVPKGAREGEYSSWYFYTTPANNPGNLVAPLVPGEYELRYSTAEKYITIARAAITVTPAKNEPGKVAVTLADAKQGGAIEIILDASGSMLQKLGTERRIDIAKRTLTKLTSSTIPAGTPFAFRVFGREVDSCQTDLDVPVAPLNPTAVGQRIAALVAKNGAKTPIGASLDKVADDLKSVQGEKLIVLVTDGEETCGGDPAAAIERLRKAGISTRVSIVGFALDDEKLATTFRRWSDAGGGAFFDAKDAAGLDKSLTEALRPGFEVVNAQGQLLASGLVGGDAVSVPVGNHTVRIKGRTASKPVVVKSKETATVAM